MSVATLTHLIRKGKLVATGLHLRANIRFDTPGGKG